MLGRGALTSELIEPQVPQRLDVLDRGVGGDQEGVVLALLHLRLALARIRSGLLRRLLRLEAPDLHTLSVEDGAFLVGVLRRNVVTVVHHALLIDPAVGDPLLGRGWAGGDARAGPRERRAGEQPATPGARGAGGHTAIFLPQRRGWQAHPAP